MVIGKYFQTNPEVQWKDTPENLIGVLAAHLQSACQI